MRRMLCLILLLFVLLPSSAMGRSEFEIEMLDTMATSIMKYCPETEGTAVSVYYDHDGDFLEMSVTQKKLSYEEFKNLCKYGDSFLEKQVDLTKTTLFSSVENMVNAFELDVDVIVKVVSNDSKNCFIIKNGDELTAPLDLLFFE